MMCWKRREKVRSRRRCRLRGLRWRSGTGEHEQGNSEARSHWQKFTGMVDAIKVRRARIWPTQGNENVSPMTVLLVKQTGRSDEPRVF
jgi:hypothetical protein